MGIRQEIMEKNFEGCMPIVIGMLLALVFCLMIALVSCKPSERIVEVEKWQHDTTTVRDTIHITDWKIRHDSVFIKEYVTQLVKDSTQTNVAWKYYTYDSVGNITSLMDYNSTTQSGSTSHNSSVSAQTSVGGELTTHEETGSHNESTGHSDGSKEKEYVKVGLNKWQKFIMGLGYVFLALLGVGVAFGILRLYGKKYKL